MADIDNLNFKVILDDKEFGEKVKQDIALAKELNTSLSTLLDIKRQVGKFNQDDVLNNRKARQIQVDTARAQEKINREHEKTIGLKNKLNAQVDRINKGYQTQSRILSELKGYALGYLSIHGASQLLSSLVRVTGEFELQKTTLGAMLGDLNKAEQVITKIQGLAVESPFQFKELTTYAKQLSAFSVPAQELYDTTKMLADISAGLGVGMDRIVLAYGQVRSAAFLRGQEVRQFTEAGIPILDELAKQFTELEGRVVSTGEIFDKISKRQVPFEMVAKVFKDMTSEGGKFYNMQEVQAETLRGKLSNLKDAYEVMLNEIGKGQSENLKGAVDWARKLMENYEETGKVLVELVAAYGVYKAAIIAADVATSTFSTTNYKLIHALVSAGKWVATNPYALLAAGITAIGFAAYKSISQLEPFEKIRKSVTESEAKYNNTLALEEANLEKLYTKLRLATKGTEEYESARREIYTKYASYISALKAEGVQVNDLVGIYDKLKTKINEAVQAKMRNMAVNDLEREFGDQMDKIEKSVDRTLKSVKRSLKRELTIGEEVGLRKYILGGDEDILKSPELMGINNFLKNVKGFNVVEYTRKQVASVVNEYQKGKDKIDAIFGEEQPVEGDVAPFVYPKIDTEGKSPAEFVQEQIDAVRRLKSAYDTLAPYMNGDMLRKTLTALFPNADQELIKSLDFRGKLVELAAELNQFDQEASAKLLDSISGDKASEIVSAFKAIETYKNTLDSWLGEDFNLTGKGVAFDISKIIRDLNNQYAQINKKAIDANKLLTKAQMGDEAALKTVREAYGEDVWQQYLINGEAVIEELAKKERESAKKTADEKIRDKASSYVKELLDEKNIDLTDLNDKSTSQLRTLIDRMKGLQTELSREMGDLASQLMQGNVDEGQMAQWDMLAKVIEMLGLKIKDVGVELERSVFEKMAEGVGVVSTMADEITKLGEAMGLPGIEEFGKQMSEVSEFVADLLPKVQELQETMTADGSLSDNGEVKSWKELSDSAKGGIIGLIAGVATMAFSKITDIISSARNEQENLTEATLAYNEALLEIRRNSYDGMFGADDMALAAENAKILAEAQEEYANSLNEFENNRKVRREKYFQNAIVFKKQSVSDVLGHIADSQGWDLYRENGELNMDALMAYYDAYAEHLTNKQRDVVDALIASYEAQNEAAAQSAEYMASIFSGVADTIASDMVAAFIESGNAAIDLREAVSDVASQMASDLIKSLYIMPVLNDYASQLQAITSNSALTADEKTAAALAVFKTAVTEIEGNKDAINETLQKLDEYFLHPEEEGTSALGEGIKGITEDQANLIASYLNAIRADVSVMRSLQAKYLPAIGESMPSIMDHLAKIQANTYDISISNAEMLAILLEFRSAMTTDGGDAAFRIYS